MDRREMTTVKSGHRGVRDRFDLSGRVAVITGGAGLLGLQHAEAIAEMGGIPVLADIREKPAKEAAAEIAGRHGSALAVPTDITDPASVRDLLDQVLSSFGRVDILINNAANDPKASDRDTQWSRLETFPFDVWQRDLAVGLTGAMLCSQVIGTRMADAGSGVILNIASDLALIGPDQRIYRQPGVAADKQPVKPVSYSVVKAGLLGLTRYLATYWAHRGVRVNAISPGGVEGNNDPAFVASLTNLIPLGRMASVDEYKAVVVFLVSDASAYMTGANLVIDGGRTAW
jgi:NAD(P)-dependent dehydrogenase (short-subunit alcohol dehydrogenase family)